MAKPLNDNICEEQLFSSIFKKYSKDLHDFLYYKFGSQLNPQDKMQEAFVKLWENCAKVPANKAKSFLFTTANNMMLNEYAHQKVVLKHRQIKPKHSTNLTPEFLLQEKQYQEKLERALANLTDAQRVAFLMNRVEGKRFKEIAELLGISTKAVEKRIYGALKKLREDIDEL
ncbi:RNA polymerase sigma factor [Psychroserpens sp.]|uniref:RNA polymerase sigma factor n=1 Tax=Psychroserpens sp. TaxID=2020870 RepID=UPI001B012558|nr:sigma-70 family RNA polymerase sigma factor [Psychroserpens sp.]MBO6606276.1 sigma-70 family RNA polymerase sigma factor [Psychroserpens sp.]MBO6631250.1 sigma-70 family RNA polymerase sigma factor [Psychroserpens sp.]MBO6655130.1 sigma-70 family RNA polymerase sigma factor [Psychroserpens sp.]MBO6683280.1 sigma-70 family RNA polymerase sigma factor [Psychroserpens sp.]MBO6751393.1 sigma-70 family RNA polymerase sigma factor [Psychroserpens sp.]